MITEENHNNNSIKEEALVTTVFGDEAKKCPSTTDVVEAEQLAREVAEVLVGTEMGVLNLTHPV